MQSSLRRVRGIRSLHTSPDPLLHETPAETMKWLRTRTSAAMSRARNICYRERHSIFFVGTVGSAIVWWKSGSSDPVLSTFESSICGNDSRISTSPAAADSPPGGPRVQRPGLEAILEKLLSSPKEGRYAVVFGEPGTGKSTAIRAVLPSISRKGLVYIEVPEDATHFVPALASTVGFKPVPDSLDACIRESILSTWPFRTVPHRLRARGVSFHNVTKCILDAGDVFKGKHKRPVVLVVDGAERIAQQDPALFAELTKFAHEGARHHESVLVVLVMSDFAALKTIDFDLSYSYATMSAVVGDIPDVTATKYLTDRGVPVEAASEAVSTLTGGRMSLLRDYARVYAACGPAAMRPKLYADASSRLSGTGVARDHALFLRLSRADLPPLTFEEASKIAGSEGVLEQLVAAGIIAGHPRPDSKREKSTMTFQSRHVESFLNGKLTL
jgi:hypothetical protein